MSPCRAVQSIQRHPSLSFQIRFLLDLWLRRSLEPGSILQHDLTTSVGFSWDDIGPQTRGSQVSKADGTREEPVVEYLIVGGTFRAHNR